MIRLLLTPPAIMDDTTFEAIRDYTHQTAFNTEFGVWDGAAIAISLFSLIFAGATFYSQWKTEKNTQRLSMELQKNLLVDMIRHLYRNMVVVYTMQTKLEACGFDSYPSEEHMAKLKIPMENIHLEIFNNDAHYLKMFELYFKFRNYNEEIDIACRHLRERSITADVKRRDLQTMMFKPGFLTARIVELLESIWQIDVRKQAAAGIVVAHETNIAGNGPATPPEGYVPYDNPKDDFVKSLFPDAAADFFRMFNSDVAVECGVNSQDSPKIYMIKFN